MAYDSRMTSALTGATLRQLRYWRRPEQPVLQPEVSTHARIFYSYQDLLAIRTVVFLRGRRSLQTIRRALGNLRGIGKTEHLSRYKLVAQGHREVVLIENGHSGNGGSGVELVQQPGQYTLVIELADVIRPFEADGTEVPGLEHPRERLDVNPSVRRGHPVMSRTRVDYELVAGLVRDGVPPDEVSAYYPSVDAAAALDAVSFADHVDQVGHRAT